MLSAKSKELLKTLGIDATKLDSKKLDSIIKNLTKLNTALANDKEVDIEDGFSKPAANELQELLGLSAKDFSWHTQQELEEAKLNTKNLTKGDVEKQMNEILAKGIRDEYGITLDSKDLKEVVKAIVASESTKAVTAAKIPIDEQLVSRDKDINTLRENLTKKEQEELRLKEEGNLWKSKYELQKEDEEFSRLLPDTANPLLRASDYRQRMLEEKGIMAKKVNGVWPFFFNNIFFFYFFRFHNTKSKQSN